MCIRDSRGIGPVYADKYMKKTLRTGDLLFPDKLREKLADLVEWKNITVQGYGHEPVSVDEMCAWLEKYAFPWREYLCNTTEYLSAQADAGKSILFEAQLGALRDIDSVSYTHLDVYKRQEVGCNSVLNPGTVIGRDASVYPTSCVRGVVPERCIYKAKGNIAVKK